MRGSILRDNSYSDLLITDKRYEILVNEKKEFVLSKKVSDFMQNTDQSKLNKVCKELNAILVSSIKTSKTKII
ncbi:hypothetical protein JM79_0621 [Gramella sp. Hel_I_59]|uniref:hypothetical protein n=1 Tax=Gramella sp. Hel_I_59 TaxID=1249978 RepID=UPI00114DFA29|nr:hypothetical protein [Gramella sp. Hel_I_59]TQI69736.1 hypothetical protein JM79_0621 [Gramella sp. Hel_I_59]